MISPTPISNLGIHQNINLPGSFIAGLAPLMGSFDPSGVFPTGLPYVKKSTLIAIASPACRQTTIINNILLICLSVALRTGYRFLSRNATLIPNPAATNTRFRIVIGDHDIRATGIHIRFEYPYKAQHSSRFADSLPKYLSARNNTTGMTSV